MAKLIYNPEFLREKHANEDFINSEMKFLVEIEISEKVSNAYLKHSKCKTQRSYFMDLKSASLLSIQLIHF